MHTIREAAARLDVVHLRIQEGTTESVFYSGVFTEKVDKDVLEFPAQNKCADIRVMRNYTCTCPPFANRDCPLF